MDITDTADIYMSFDGLARLRHDARSSSPAALREAAQQFEALFLQMMLKSMRTAGLGEGIFDNEQTRLYTDLLDKQVAVDIAESGRFGLAEVIVKQLGEGNQQTAPPAGPALALSREGKAGSVREVRLEPVVQKAPSAGAETAPVPTDEVLSPPPKVMSFVRDVWPHARRTAAQIGVAPEVLVAQAALETGWGEAVMRHPDGRSSYNLFGIKAGSAWSGPTVQQVTTEFRHGRRMEVVQTFRAYGSYEESFQDYGRLIRSSPRYREALETRNDPHAYIRAVAAGGYATDPAYAEKVTDILRRPYFEQVVRQVKNRVL